MTRFVRFVLMELRYSRHDRPIPGAVSGCPASMIRKIRGWTRVQYQPGDQNLTSSWKEKGFELKLNEVTGLTVGGTRCFKQSIYVLEFSVHGILFRALLVAATILWLILVIIFSLIPSF